jgi:hypothetical protein
MSAANVNLIVGNDASNTLQGTAGDDLIYGFNPNGPQGQVSSIAATRVANGLSQPLFAAAVWLMDGTTNTGGADLPSKCSRTTTVFCKTEITNFCKTRPVYKSRLRTYKNVRQQNQPK